jgi:hypothetical protein
MKYVINRAHPDSPAGREFAHLAIAVDTHGCLVFVCKDTEKFQPVAVPRAQGDYPFTKLYPEYVTWV